MIVTPYLETRLTCQKPGEIAEGVYQIKNQGGKALQFKIQASCGCSSIAPTQGTLVPGQTIPVRFGVHLNTVGEKKAITINFMSDEPGNPTITRIVRGEIPSPFEFEPASLQFGRLKPGVKQSKTLAVKVVRGGTEQIDIKTDHPSIQIERIDAVGSTIHYRVNMTLGESDPSTGRIVFRSSEGVEDSVLVTGEIHRPVIVTPPIVYLHSNDDDDSTLVGHVIVSLTDDDDLGELQAQDDVTVRFVEMNRSNRRRRFLTVKVKAHAIKEGERLKRIFRYSKLDRDLSIELVRNR